jgi:hypothetical protein
MPQIDLLPDPVKPLICIVLVEIRMPMRCIEMAAASYAQIVLGEITKFFRLSCI